MTTQTLSDAPSGASTSSPDTLSAKPDIFPTSVESVRQGGEESPKPRTTMDELFPIPESKSPRILWMERHHLTTHHQPYDHAGPLDKAEHYAAIHGMKPIGYGATPDEALVAAAKSLNIRLWNEDQ